MTIKEKIKFEWEVYKVTLKGFTWLGRVVFALPLLFIVSTFCMLDLLFKKTENWI